MFHSSLDHFVDINRWRSRPPTGQQMKLTLACLASLEEVEHGLAYEMRRSLDYVRWCLNSEATVPACFLAAALRFSAGYQRAVSFSTPRHPAPATSRRLGG
ncbi:MAG: hypothetical protein EOO23_01910 [Comamonadaceae bacterium]|nr:MAG: hypothetical protein EOO23_01910 [Comamonadaceae bacterium]